jgi:DNA repair exonuclease SbcCD ATPase subunit
MTDFSSDYDTIKDLEKLTKLLEKGLQQAWDPATIIQAKSEIESIANKAKKEIQSSNSQIESIQNSLTLINLQKIEVEKEIQQLENAVKVAKSLDQLVKQLGGVDQLRQYLTKLENLNSEELDQILQRVNTAQQLANSLEQQTQELQQTTTSLIQRLDALGGTNALLEKFNKLEDIAQRLDTVDSEIQSSIDSCLERYLPDFESGKLQIEQWREETIFETQQTLASITQKTQSIDESLNDLSTNYQEIKNLSNRLDKKEFKLQSILDAITDLTQSLGGKPLVSEVLKKLTDLDNFFINEKSTLNTFKTELEESLDDEMEELAKHNEEMIIRKLADLENFMISAKSNLNIFKEQIEEGLDQKLQKLVYKNVQELTKKQNQLEEKLRNEFQSLLNEKIVKLETQHNQKIRDMKNGHFRPWW